MKHFPSCSRWLGCCALLPLLPVAAPAQSLNVAKLDSLLTSLAKHQKMMGSVAVMRAGQVVYSRAFGLTQLQPPLTATPATRYRVNYLNQLFTTVLIYQLVEEGKLTLNTPLARFLPKFPRAADITVNYLLNERSGLRPQAYPPGKVMTSAQLLDFIAKPAAFAEISPGVPRVHPNYVLLEAIIGQVTKQPYAQALQTRILNRAGMRDTYFTRAPKNRKRWHLKNAPTAGSPVPISIFRGQPGRVPWCRRPPTSTAFRRPCTGAGWYQRPTCTSYRRYAAAPCATFAAAAALANGRNHYTATSPT
jgi:CubicO group peptidase (beta-lactamase class C family)